MSTIELIIEVETARACMEHLAARYGLADPRVLKQSQELDRPILELQRRARIMDVKKLPSERGKMIACDECGKMFMVQAITEVKIARVPYFLYLCTVCTATLAGILRGQNRAAG